jgi:hypothetical protein
MIYLDREHLSDSEKAPAVRGGRCINCGRYWIDHIGWRCPTSNRLSTSFSRLPSVSRFLTQAMIDSLPTSYVAAPAPATAKTADDSDDWRAWRHNAPGDCPCGIRRQDCDYHR